MKERRARLGQTQAEVAKYVELDRGTIIRYEAGASYPGVLQQQKIAAWLGIEMEDLPPAVEKPKPKPKDPDLPPEPGLEDAETELISGGKPLPEPV